MKQKEQRIQGSKQEDSEGSEEGKRRTGYVLSARRLKLA